MTGRVSVRPLGPPGGDGPVVVFAHGLEDSWESWQPLAARFDPTWRLWALDLPWRPGNDYRWRRRHSAEWLAEALDRLDAPADLVVAHSFGANALLELMCAGSPATPAAAALVCPLYRPPDVEVSWRIFDRSRRAFEQHIHDSLVSRLGMRTRALPAEVVATMIGKAIDRVGPAGFLAVFEQFTSSAHLALGAIDTPALVLAGGADPTLSPAAAGTLAGNIPHARLLVDDHYDHFCYVRRPGEVAEQILDFWSFAGRPAPQPEGAVR